MLILTVDTENDQLLYKIFFILNKSRNVIASGSKVDLSKQHIITILENLTFMVLVNMWPGLYVAHIKVFVLIPVAFSATFLLFLQVLMRSF